MKQYLRRFRIKGSKQEKRSWVPALLAFGVAFFALGLSILGAPRWVGWFLVGAGIVFIGLAFAWIRPAKPSNDDQ